MTTYNVGDKVRRLHDSHLGINVGEVAVVTSLSGAGTNIQLNYYKGGSHKLANLVLVETVKPTYPNPPHKHAELIKAWADGAEIEVEVTVGCGRYVPLAKANKPLWLLDRAYRIKPTKTAKDVKLEELEANMRKLADEIKELRNE
tara:strand:+ start:33381 stop:33815 length:435 start_codon:yes stop_codon:yes gene_type:complete